MSIYLLIIYYLYPLHMISDAISLNDVFIAFLNFGIKLFNHIEITSIRRSIVQLIHVSFQKNCAKKNRELCTICRYIIRFQ